MADPRPAAEAAALALNLTPGIGGEIAGGVDGDTGAVCGDRPADELEARPLPHHQSRVGVVEVDIGHDIPAICLAAREGLQELARPRAYDTILDAEAPGACWSRGTRRPAIGPALPAPRPRSRAPLERDPPLQRGPRPRPQGSIRRWRLPKPAPCDWHPSALPPPPRARSAAAFPPDPGRACPAEWCRAGL